MRKDTHDHLDVIESLKPLLFSLQKCRSYFDGLIKILIEKLLSVTFYYFNVHNYSCDMNCDNYNVFLEK